MQSIYIYSWCNLPKTHPWTTLLVLSHRLMKEVISYDIESLDLTRCATLKQSQLNAQCCPTNFVLEIIVDPTTRPAWWTRLVVLASNIERVFLSILWYYKRHTYPEYDVEGEQQKPSSSRSTTQTHFVFLLDAVHDKERRGSKTGLSVYSSEVVIPVLM